MRDKRRPQQTDAAVTLANVREIAFTEHGDARGRLIPLEAMSSEVPFEVKRAYFIFDTTPGTARGNHAHKSLRQVLVCVSGACTIDCEMPDGTTSSHRLDWPTKGLLVEGLVWRTMRDFSKDAVLFVLASEHYSESDYVRDYAEFLRLARAEHQRQTAIMRTDDRRKGSAA